MPFTITLSWRTRTGDACSFEGTTEDEENQAEFLLSAKYVPIPLDDPQADWSDDDEKETMELEYLIHLVCVKPSVGVSTVSKIKLP